MKIIFTLLGFSLLLCTAQAQSRTPGKDRKSSATNGATHLLSAQRTQSVNDTLGANILPGCNVGPFLLGTDEGGFLAGTNGYGDLEKAQFINTNTNGSIHSVLVAFGGKVIVGTPDEYNAKIYSGNTAIGPQTQLGSNSANVSSTNIDTAGNFTRFAFATPISYNGAFFASVVVDGNNKNDSIGIFHTAESCGGPSAWELWDDNTWNSFLSGWEIDPVMYIFVEVDAIMSTDNPRLIERGSHKVFPNPGKGETTLTYSLLKGEQVEISLSDLAGRQVSVKNLGFQTQGLNAYRFNTANLPNGIYLYTIRAGNQRLTGKFVVSK